MTQIYQQHLSNEPKYSENCDLSKVWKGLHQNHHQILAESLSVEISHQSIFSTSIYEIWGTILSKM